jgi:hypothetical protein
VTALMETRDVCRHIGRSVSESFGNRVFRAYEPGCLFQDVRVHMMENGLVALDFQNPSRRLVFSADILRKLADEADACASAGGQPIKPLNDLENAA